MQSGPNAIAILDALGDPIRRTIFQRLRRAEASGTQLAKGLPVTRSAVSRHLTVLTGAGLVEARVEGRSRIFSVRAGGLSPLSAWIG
jgi:DNA-binding transcriptional ArsR family regulator